MPDSFMYFYTLMLVFGSFLLTFKVILYLIKQR